MMKARHLFPVHYRVNIAFFIQETKKILLHEKIGDHRHFSDVALSSS